MLQWHPYRADQKKPERVYASQCPSLVRVWVAATSFHMYVRSLRLFRLHCGASIRLKFDNGLVTFANAINVIAEGTPIKLTHLQLYSLVSCDQN